MKTVGPLAGPVGSNPTPSAKVAGQVPFLSMRAQAINRGMRLEAIAALLGHRSMRMTLTYANPWESRQTRENSQVAC